MSSTPLAPRFIRQIELEPPFADPELAAFQTLQDNGFNIAPFALIPAELEQNFYQLNNLPEQLNMLFKGVNLADPDEDDIEEIAPEAEALFKKHFLLDETIDLIYSAIETLASRVRVRRCGAEGVTAIRGRPALIALKNLWQADWSFDALMDRLEQTQGIALEARHMLIQSADQYPADDTMNKRASDVLGQTVKLWLWDESVARVEML